MKKTIFLSKKIDVLVVSSGGVGTTFLMEEIAKYKNVNCPSNTDGYKHMPIPPISFNRHLKVVYIFGNPIDACISLFRRKYQHTQSVRNQQYLKPQYIIPQDLESLEQYANKRLDGLCFEQHFNNWFIKHPIYSTIFIKYEELFKELDTIAKFLKLPPDFKINFPKKRKRQANVFEVSREIKGGLYYLYGSFQKKVDELPAIVIHAINKKGLFNPKYFSMPYYRGIKRIFWMKNRFLRRGIDKLHRSFVKYK